MLVIVKPITTQDHSRLALSEAIVRTGSVNIDPWVRGTADRARYGQHWYSDKAPGLSLFALPEVAVSTAVPGSQPWLGPWRRWLVRLLVNGPLLLALCLILGRLAEGVAPGTGTLVAVTTGVGTLLGPLSSILFEHVGAALFAFGAFVLAGRSRHTLAGVAAGISVLWEYEAAIAVTIIGLYIGARGIRHVAPYVLGIVPSALLLGAYDTAAFGSPLHLSYRYVDNGFTEQQGKGFFGVGIPSITGLHTVLLGGSGFRPGDWGLLVTCPVLILAAAGLVLLWRQGARREAAACASIGVSFVIWDAGYFAPYGGQSPGPRFAATGIPFLLVGLVYALERFPLATVVLVLLSLALSTFAALAWGPNDKLSLAHLPATVWSLAGASRTAGVGVCALAATIAAFIGLLPMTGRITSSIRQLAHMSPA